MRCPFCKADHDKVIDSRSSSAGAVIRRRRQCLLCSRRYTTYERVEELPLRVVKKDGRRAPFDRKQILQGMLKACEKRPIGYDQLEEITDRIESQINEMFEREVGSKMIGHMVMKELHGLDPVAYIRFASVYREFKDVHEFVDEVKPLLEGRDGDEPDQAGEPDRPDEPHLARSDEGVIREDGVPGESGTPGESGAPGESGTPGESGAPGESGTIPDEAPELPVEDRA